MSEVNTVGILLRASVCFFSWKEKKRRLTGFRQLSHIIFAEYLLHVVHAIDLSEFCQQNFDFKQRRSRSVRAAGRMSAGPVEFSILRTEFACR